MRTSDLILTLSARLREQLAAQLAPEDIHKSFLQLGVDSVVAMELVEFIRKEICPGISASALFDYPTIAELAGYLAEQKSGFGAAVAEASTKVTAVSGNLGRRDKTSKRKRPRGGAQESLAASAEDRRDPVREIESHAGPIAIVGMAGRFPGADTVDEFWRNLAAGVCSISEIPVERSRFWDLANLAAAVPRACRWGGFLKGFDRFDPLFFGISPKEAAVMDPQHRLFLEEAWKAIEDAGYAAEALADIRCGVYAGVMNNDYQDLLTHANALTPEVHELMGNAGSILAARIAYHLNLRGPAITVDTACSSSLVAIHLACRALQQGEITLALAGGVTLYLTQRRYTLMEQAGMLSRTGACRPFDDAADGFIPGEGVGVVLLKRLDDAVASRDSIYGLIASSGTNQDGRTNGITAPSMASQCELIRDVYRRAEIDPQTLQYVEAHGTATKLGDPIEAEALTRAFQGSTRRAQACRLGSVKANIGHASAAAGVAGLIKVLLALKHRSLPPQVHFQTPNQHIPFANGPFRVNSGLEPWEIERAAPRRAAVSAFGFSGTNCHLVVEEAPVSKLCESGVRASPRAGSHKEFVGSLGASPSQVWTSENVSTGPPPACWITLSAKTASALERKARDLECWLAGDGADSSLADLSFTLNVGRSAFEERLAFIARDLAEVRTRLNQFLAGTEDGLNILRGRVTVAEADSMLPLPVDSSGTVTAGFADSEFARLGRLWVAGTAVPWARLYEGLEVRRVHLPAYPFEKELCWYDALKIPPSPRGRASLRANLSEQSVGSPGVSPSQWTHQMDSAGNPLLNPAELRESSAVRIKLRGLGPTGDPLHEPGRAELPLGPEIGDAEQRVPTRFSGSTRVAKSTAPRSAEDVIPKVRQLVARTLYVDVGRVSDDGKFSDLGLDSILAVELVKHVNTEFGTNLSAANLYDHPTTRQLAVHVCEVLSSDPTTDENRASRLFAPELPVQSESRAPDDTPVKPVTSPGVNAASAVGGETRAPADPLSPPPGREAAHSSCAADGDVRGPIICPASHPERGRPRPQHNVFSGARPSPGAAKSERDPALEPFNMLENAELAMAEDGHSPLNRYRAARVVVARSGGIDDLQFAPEDPSIPAPNEVQIAVQAASVMLADWLCVRGLYPTMPPYPFTPGFEVAGIVRQVGQEVTALRPGDRVYGLTGDRLGGQASTVNVDSRLVAAIPESLTFVEACTLPVAFLTAYYSLVEVGKLQAGETLLIHSAASSTGLMAIQLARLKGAEVFATVGSDEKAGFLRGLGVNKVWNYHRGDIIQMLKDQLPRGQANLALNLLTGPIRDQSLKLLAPFGRFLDLAVAGLKAATPVDLSALVDNQAYFGIDCRRVSQHRPADVGRWLRLLSEMVDRREIFPLPVNHRFELREAQQAYALVQSRVGVGRVILLPAGQNEEVATQSLAPKSAAAIRSPGRPLRHPAPPPMFEPIAVAGVSGRFAGARDLDCFWQNLVSGKSSVSEIPAHRWPMEGFFDPDPRNPKTSYSRWGGFLEGIDEFDPAFFNIAPAEAEQMDPQQRLFLQESWKALEDAGYSPRELSGRRCGVFVGVGPSDYYSRISEPEAHSLAGNIGSVLAGRLAYVLDWTGPCIAVDTACASSFSAIHLACRSLAQRECDLVLAGGAHLMTSPKVYLATSRMGILSPTGKCKTFDVAADGWVLSEGVGAVVLKRLDDAVRDGDQVYGVIRGCGLNQDGAKNGLTAPKAAAQAELQRRVYQQAGIDPATIEYLEVQGTSSTLGDEIEILGLKESFAAFTQAKGFCALGSVKPNIGHPVAAAGMAALLKVLLALKHGQLPPTIHLENMNEAFGLEASPFYVNTELCDWTRREGRPRRAAINGFGVSGTNCHLIIEEYLAPQPVETGGDPANSGLAETGDSPANGSLPMLLVLSARDEERLRESAANLRDFLLQHPDLRLIDVAFTLQVGRHAMEERLAFAVSSLDEAQGKLSNFLEREADDTIRRGRAGSGGEASLLISGDEGTQYLAALIRNRSLDRLGRLWTAGVDIDWNLLYRGARPSYLFGEARPSPGAATLERDPALGPFNMLENAEPAAPGDGHTPLNRYTYRPSRISLPTYPFAREHYWLRTRASKTDHAPERPQATSVKSDTRTESLAGPTRGNGQCSAADTGSHLPVPPAGPIVKASPNRLDRIIGRLREIIAGVLRLSEEAIDNDGDLFRHGFNSLYVLRVIDQFEGVTGFRIPARAFFEQRTIHRLAQTLLDDPGFARAEAAPAFEPTGCEVSRRRGSRGRNASQAADRNVGVTQTFDAGSFPLSEGQKALWSIQQANPADTSYLVPVAIWRDEPWATKPLQQALQQLAVEQPALRTCFGFEVDEPVQGVREATAISVSETNLEGLSEAEATLRIRDAARSPFALDQAPLWRACSFRVAPRRHVLLLTFHHLIFDGHSLELLLEDLERYYEAAKTGREATPRIPRCSFPDFVRAEQSYLASEACQSDRNYWLDQFPAGFAQLDLPGSASRGISGSSLGEPPFALRTHWDHEPGGRGFTGALKFRADVEVGPPAIECPPVHGQVFETLLAQPLVRALNDLASAERTSVQAVFLAAFQGMLGWLCRQDHVVVGVPVDVRPSSDFEEVIGYFINLLPIRATLSRSASFRDLLRQVFERQLEAFEHRRFPFRQLVRTLAESTASEVRSGLRAAFYFHTWSTAERRKFADRWVAGIHQSGEFDLVFEVIETAKDWRLNVKYRSGEFAPATIQRFAEAFIRLLESVADNPSQPLSDLLPHAHGAAAETPAKIFEYPRHRCVHELIEEQAGRTPDAVAVIFENRQLTYRELDNAANQLAHYLVEKAGVRPGALVGVLMHRSLEMVIGLLGVLKAGAAYVPLDPHYPDERIASILDDARVQLLIAHATSTFHPEGVRTVNLDREWTAIARQPAHRPAARAGPDDLAYVIYTSGSTGTPKGVQIGHRSLTHFLSCMVERPGCNPSDHVLALTTICFDIAALELYLPLITGARVEILSEAITANGLRLREKIENSRATLIQATPATWRMLLAAELGTIPRVKALCGGEAWDLELAEQLLPRVGELWNMYGPTETTVWSSTQKVEPGQPVRLGEPIGNTQFYVLDENMNPAPRGGIGELFIGGDGLAKGYLNQPELTKERFIRNPFRPDELIYRTGDRVRYV